MYDYVAQVIRLVDGDTMHLQVDPGLDIRVNLIIRLWGLNAPEMSTDTGKAAKAWVEQWLAEHAPTGLIVLHTIKDKREKYGRYLGIVYPAMGTMASSLNDEMLAAGQAVPYMVN
jgi:endonuclease YncB( thermonuclease family)